MDVDFDKIEAKSAEKVAAEKAAEKEANKPEKTFKPDPKLWITFSVIAILMVCAAVYIQFFM